LYAARGGASFVPSVELSRPALETAETNFKLNRDDKAIANTRHEAMVGDAFEVLAILGEAGHEFDMVIIDPPSFARRKGDEAGALAAYGRLVKQGLAVLRPQGTLVTSSCSSRIAAADFYDVVHKSAIRLDRPLTEIGRTAHPLDHPITFDEGAYLKCLYAVG
jgi:23S rRNA (cytosine1962-C5)-methyltransferase